MIAVGELNQFVVFNAVSLVYTAIRRVKALHRKALLGVKQEVINFLGYALLRHIVHVVLVGRKACPVALGNVSLAHGQVLGV